MSPRRVTQTSPDPMDRVVLDTDVSSLSLKRRLPPAVLTRLIGQQPCVTFVTLGELTQWAELRQWGRNNRDALERWLDGVIVLPYDEDVARTWGRISAAAIRRGRPRPANDTWIAACALAYGLPLATLNIKDFEDFATYDGLHLVAR
jgi:predicted nucleic acid-binding protein